MASQDCIDAIRDAHTGRRKLTDRQVLKIAEEVNRMAGRNATPAEFAAAADQHFRNEQEAVRIMRRNRQINFRAMQRAMLLMGEADSKYGDAALGIKALLISATRGLTRGKASTDTIKKVLFARAMGSLTADLRRNNLLDAFGNVDFHKEVMKALEKITRASADGSESQVARDVADIIHKHRGVAFDLRNRAGAWVQRLEGYVMRQSHDMGKINKAGKTAWKAFIRDHLDSRTFDHLDSADPADIDNFLNGVYKALTEGEQHVSGDAPRTLNLAFKGPQNLAKKISNSHRTLHFKNAESSHAYNEKFGTGSLVDSIVHEFETYARDTAILNTLGTNPQAFLDNLIANGKRRYGFKKRLIDSETTIRQQFDVVTGRADMPGSITLASAGAWVRFVQNSSKLGGAVLASVIDPVTMVAGLRNSTGRSIFSSIGSVLEESLGSFNDRDKKIFIELSLAYFDGQRGSGASRWTPDDGVSFGNASRANRMFFKINLLTQWTDFWKKGMGLAVARHAGMQKGVAWDALDPQFKHSLEQVGIVAAEWDVAQLAIKPLKGKDYLWNNEIRNLPDSEFTSRGLNPALKDEIEIKFRTYMTDSVEAGVPTPGARERVLLTQGTRAGTPLGEVMRAFAQFKGFPVTIMTKVLGRAYHNTHDSKADVVGLVSYIAMAWVMGYAAMTLKNFALGKGPPSLDEEHMLDTLMRAFAQGGAGGFYADLILSEATKYGKSPFTNLAGPSAGTIDEGLSIFSRLIDGKNPSMSALRLAIQTTPYNNLAGFKHAVDYLLIYQLQEMINPGYLKRAERRVNKDGVEYKWFAPTGAQ